MKKICILLFLTCVSLANAINQDTTLMTIGNEKITLGEFEYLYNKNKLVVSNDVNNIEDYVELFTNFNLKVVEAKNLGYDTIPKFVKELSGYRDQLAKPYLKDQNLDQQILLEAYNRLKEEVEASHILISINNNDTLKAYNEAMKAREEILAGATFGEVANKYSDDPSVVQNNGYLGYFSGSRMIFHFEDAAFKLPVGGISQPVRTRFGYHIITVTDRRPARGEINVSHILIACNNKMTEAVRNEKQKIAFDVYRKIQEGENFAALAQKYSEDYGSSNRGGNIGLIRTGQTIPEFEEAAFALKKSGDVSEPVLTNFGWHIILLNNKETLPSFEEKKAEIKRQLARDERGTKPEEVFISNLKKEYSYIINEENLRELYDTDFAAMDSTTKANKISTLQKTIIKFGDIVKTQNDLIQYTTNGTDFESQFAAFEKESLIEYEKSRLELKYDDFKYLINEYHDGLLLFDISNDMVWKKASKDKKGLNKFYKKNKKNYLFTDSCFAGEIIYLKDSSTLVQYENLKNALSLEEIEDSLNIDSKVIKTENGFYCLGDNSAIDKYEFGNEEITLDSDFSIVLTKGSRYEIGDIKPLKATRGICISDYQNFLEKNWIKQLRKKHKVVIDKSLLQHIEK